MAGQRGFKARMDVREAMFLSNYYGEKSPTKGNGQESARAAGYSESVALTKWPRILKKFGDNGIKDSLQAVGITKPYLAMKIKHILENGKVTDMIPALRMALAGLGEVTGEGGNVSVNATGPVMVIVGASPERMRALKAATPQLSREQKEIEENQRVEHKLQLLREGRLPELNYLPDGRVSRKHPEVIDVESPVPNLDKHDDKPPVEIKPENG
jgi:hypothetical protein